MDRPPAELNQTEPRLISRFHCGLVTDIQPPDFETRIAILQKRAEEDRIIIDESILTFIAENIINNIRELEGALIRLAAHQSITGQSIDLNTTKRILRDILKSKPTKTSVETIQNAVADYYHIPADLIRGDCRKKEIATARQVAIYLCHTMTDLTLKSIGSHFGNRDHSTILYSLEIVKRRISVEADFREKVDEIKRNIESLYK
jgi:chromosomal replication initiator protein